MNKTVKKVMVPALAAVMAVSSAVCVSAAEDETIKLTVWGACLLYTSDAADEL